MAEHFAPAYKAGGIVRCLENLVMHLGTRYSFYVLTSNNNLDKNELLVDVDFDEWHAYRNRSHVFYTSRQNQKFRTISAAIQTLQPDVIYINGLYSPFFTLMPLWLAKNTNPKPVIVLAPWGMLHNGSLSIKPLKKKVYLRLFRWLGFSRNIKWHGANEQERDDIVRLFGKRASVTLADALPDTNPIDFRPIAKTNEVLRLIGVSLVTPNKGHLRVIKALKELQEQIQAEYHIYGPIKDESFWQTCQEEIKALKSTIKVIYHGFLNPSDLVDALQRSHVFILHSDGENFCQAIYEALAAGRPVITSDQTPWNELKETKSGWNAALSKPAALKQSIHEAYCLKQEDYDKFCRCAQQRAKQFVAERNFEEQYDLLFQREIPQSSNISAYTLR